METRWPALGLTAAGVGASAGWLFFGLVLLTTLRGNPLVFWLLEIIVLVAVWGAIVHLLGVRVPTDNRGDRSPAVLRAATLVSAVVFLALWFFAVALGGGKVDLIVVLAYVVASGAFLFLVSFGKRVMSEGYTIRMPLVTAGAVVLIATGLFYLGGGTL